MGDCPCPEGGGIWPKIRLSPLLFAGPQSKCSLTLPYLTRVSAESILWKVYEYFIQGTTAATEVTRVGLLAGRKSGLFCSS